MEAYALTLDEACAFLGISRSTASNWIRSGRLTATRKDPSKPKSPYLVTRQACIAALNNPMHTVAVSAGVTRRRAASELRNLLAQRTESKHRSCTTAGRLNCGE
ncbi:MAG: helix-turn-helix domain-containing protein [Mixta calida]|uniref:helix-turn-helix domain-containing protein n=1 Tax=Mixta calida TaxID=665913 RepID=UPI002909254E|nr:helix-turn-helix domain-containing protein [Mixta calida]MDU4940347.1 helix-turn-helix domain-containing protein [Mixta calida]